MPEVQKVTATEQATLAEYSPEYAAFVEKFKPKLTTDDCYTPGPVFEAVSTWVAKEYGLDPETFTRPFWPGGDYEHQDYTGRVVVDNPPFSILAAIMRFYEARGIRFFLFAPTLTLFSSMHTADVCALATSAKVTYENGAVINTSFLTNLEPDYRVRTAPDLCQAIETADRNARAPKMQPHYDYPPELLTAAQVSKWSHYGVDFRVRKDESSFTRRLDSMRRAGKSVYGGGLLVSERVAREAQEAAALARMNQEEMTEASKEKDGSVWQLSALEREIVRRLGNV